MRAGRLDERRCFTTQSLSSCSVALRIAHDNINPRSWYHPLPVVGGLDGLALFVGGGLQVGLGAEVFDLVGEVGEDVGDVVEAVGVGAGDVADALFAPGAEAGVPVPGGVLGAARPDGGGRRDGYRGLIAVDFMKPAKPEVPEELANAHAAARPSASA